LPPSRAVAPSISSTTRPGCATTSSPPCSRRQILSLTDHGRELLGQYLDAAQGIDAEMTAAFSGDDRAALHRIFGALADQLGLPS
jgi:DNA-binding MarR family transcriptional regulator